MKMKMNVKKISAFLLSLVLCVSFASCGKAEAPAEEVTTAAETTTAVTTTTTAPETTTAEKETTTAKKKKKKKKTTTAEKSEKTEKTTTEKKSTEKKSDKKIVTDDAFDNGIFTLSFSTLEWSSLDAYKSLIKKAAGESDPNLDAGFYDQMVGSIYIYTKDGKTVSNPPVVVISNPIYDSTLSGVKIDDFADLMVQQLEAQYANQITLNSSDLIDINGTRVLRLKARADKGGTSYNSDEYVFIANNNLCIITVTTFGGNEGMDSFEKMINTLKIK